MRGVFEGLVSVTSPAVRPTDIEEVEEDIGDSEELYINGQSIVEIISHLAKSKAKDHLSLSTKAIFKFMDLIDM